MSCTNLLEKEQIKAEFIKTIRAILIKVLHVNEWCWLVSWDWLGPLYKCRRMVVERKWFLSRWKYWWSSHYDEKEVKSIHVHVTIIGPKCLLLALSWVLQQVNNLIIPRTEIWDLDRPTSSMTSQLHFKLPS